MGIGVLIMDAIWYYTPFHFTVDFGFVVTEYMCVIFKVEENNGARVKVHEKDIFKGLSGS
jgi:hypothetical protein